MGDFSLGEATSDEVMTAELTAGMLFQAIRELGLPPEHIERIAGTITAIVREGDSRFNHCSPGLPARICLFCNRKGMDSVHQPGDQMKGGWGYYVIEQGRDFLHIPWQEPCRELELYLYREGE